MEGTGADSEDLVADHRRQAQATVLAVQTKEWAAELATHSSENRSADRYGYTLCPVAALLCIKRLEMPSWGLDCLLNSSGA